MFHIQTEDSGVRHPHVITHLFADGGRILKTTKTSYAEHLGQDRLAETVRAMMQEQHKAMFIALRDGQFDHLFDEGAKVPAAAPSSPTAAPAPAASAPAAPAPAPSTPVAPPAPSMPVAAPAPVAAARAGRATAPVRPAEPEVSRPASPVPPQPPPADPVPASRKRARPTLDVDPAAIHGVGGAPSPGQPSFDLDLDALERAAAEAQTPFFQQIQDLPPPPAAVLGQKRSSPGGYSVRPPPQAGAPPPVAAPRRPSPRPATPPVTPAPPARYAPSRPASIFATTSPREGSSIFGEDLISEKSLDEVILGYLAEDLDAPGDKK